MSYKNIPVVIVAGIEATNRAIGKENQLLFHVPDDLKRFKELTLGQPIIMGRKTFESIIKILGKPLPKRTNIVITRDKEYQYDNVLIAHSLEEALEMAAGLKLPTIHIGGGASLYEEALPYVDKLYLTLFYANKDGDAFFPEYEKDFSETKRHGVREYENVKYEWVDFERKK